MMALAPVRVNDAVEGNDTRSPGGFLRTLRDESRPFRERVADIVQ
jgi:hypothetical protein